MVMASENQSLTCEWVILLFSFRHYPKTSFTIVTDTPENLRLKQQSMLNSQVRRSRITRLRLRHHSCSVPVLCHSAEILISLRHHDSVYLSPSLCSQLRWIPSIESNEPFGQILKWELAILTVMWRWLKTKSEFLLSLSKMIITWTAVFKSNSLFLSVSHVAPAQLSLHDWTPLFLISNLITLFEPAV